MKGAVVRYTHAVASSDYAHHSGLVPPGGITPPGMIAGVTLLLAAKAESAPRIEIMAGLDVILARIHSR